MIYGQRIGRAALDFIHCSEFIFYPTGSRFFGNATEESDHDFFVQNDPKVILALEDDGFTLEKESYADDPIMTAVYKRENVHVQVVKCAITKQSIQYQLKTIFAKMKPDKQQAKLLWIVATKLYTNGQASAK